MGRGEDGREVEAEGDRAALPFERRPALVWVASFAWWSVGGLLGAINYHQMSRLDGGGVTWAHALRTSMVASWMWAPLTVAVLWLARRHPIERGSWGRAIAIHVAGSAVVVLLRAIMIYAGDPWVGWYQSPPPFGSVLVTSVDHNLLLYWMFVGIGHAMLLARRSRERALRESRLEAQLAQAQLGALEAQLHPHFLFNTLHSLSELVHRDVEAADRMIVRLSELLRRTLASSPGQRVALREELDLLAPYLEIEQLRFGDRLSVEWAIEPAALPARVPHWILQPLVENALRHGLGPRAAPGRLRIAARVDGGRLALEVSDDGVGLGRPAERTAGSGVGVANTRARLRQLHGDQGRFELAPAPGGGARATIEIPFEAAA
jgi:two-component system, LytTR family, sensor kinase